jgi:hypothetical protein
LRGCSCAILFARHIHQQLPQTQAFSTTKLWLALTATKRQADPSHDVTYHASRWDSVSVQPYRKLLVTPPKCNAGSWSCTDSSSCDTPSIIERVRAPGSPRYISVSLPSGTARKQKQKLRIIMFQMPSAPPPSGKETWQYRHSVKRYITL